MLLLLVAMTAAADDAVSLRGCRQAKVRQTSPVCRAPRRAGAQNPFVGDRRQLVVLASFSDQQFKDSDPLGLWNRIFNEENLKESPFYGSVHDYFYAQSYGQLRLTFDLHEIALSESRLKYRSTSQDDENSKYLVSDLADVLKPLDIDWSQYDWNGDGYVDQLLIVYAGKGQNAGGGSNTIWPHQWWMSQHEGTAPIPVTSGGKEYLIDCYCCVQELYSGNDYGSFGTICHEYSHCFGFPDYYYGSTSYVHSWDLMDYGNNNNGGFCPPNYSAHERWQMGWLTPVELTEGTTVTGMSAAGDQPEAYLIRNDGHGDEYYMVENRQMTGWDQSLPNSGLVVFHINYDEDVWKTGMPNSPNLQRYTIIPANNSTNYFFRSGWPYPNNGNDALTDESTPAATLHYANSGGQKLMSKPLTHITVTDGVASFDFMGGTSDISQYPTPVAQRPVTLYDLGPIRIVRMPDGHVKKVFR